MKRLILIAMLILTLSLFAQSKLKQKNDTEKNEKIKIEKTAEKEISTEEKKVVNTPRITNGHETEDITTEKQKTFWQQSKKLDQQQTSSKVRKPAGIKDLHKTRKWKYTDTERELKPLKFKKHQHKPLTRLHHQQEVHYASPIYYHYTINPVFIYRGIWIRYYFIHDDGFFFYNGYPYYVYNNLMHRYSFDDPGFYDLVDSYTDEVYATFYGENLKESYDRAAEVRDLLNNEAGYYRYFCAERFEYDSSHNYGWDPSDFPDWYWE